MKIIKYNAIVHGKEVVITRYEYNPPERVWNEVKPSDSAKVKAKVLYSLND